MPKLDPLTSLWMPVAALMAIAQLAHGQDAIPRTISHQGLVADSSTGDPVPDGMYSIQFRLYSSAVGGSPIWTETQSLDLVSGIYNAALGAVTPLDDIQFNRDLWLSYQIASDPEMTDRTKLTSVPYALGLALPFSDTVASEDPLLQLNNNDIGEGIVVANDGFGTAGTFIQQNKDSDRSGVFAQAGGSGSAVYGQSTGTGFAGRFETTDQDNPSAAIHTVVAGAAPDIDATGYIRADSLVYNTPRVGYASVGGTAFKPELVTDTTSWWSSDVDGAYFNTPGSRMMSAIQLPHGAVITKFTCVLLDGNLFRNVTCSLYREPHIGSNSLLAQVVTVGSNPGAVQPLVDNSIDPPTRVDNSDGSYVVVASSSDWEGADRRVLQANVEYTLSAAQ